jgi:transposase
MVVLKPALRDVAARQNDGRRYLRMQDVHSVNGFSGHLFAFRGRRGHLIKILYWDGQGFFLFAKRLEKGRFTWPITKEGTITLTPALMSMLLEGLEWRITQKIWAPTVAG